MNTTPRNTTKRTSGTAYYMSRSADVWKSALRRPRPTRAAQPATVRNSR